MDLMSILRLESTFLGRASGPAVGARVDELRIAASVIGLDDSDHRIAQRYQ
jgi:hypothetical protein